MNEGLMSNAKEIRVNYGEVGKVDPQAHLDMIFGDLIKGERRLNVGCGGMYLPGWVNLDGDPLQKSDIVANLDTLPLYPVLVPPLIKESFDVILASHVLEHVEDPVGVVFQLHQLLKPGGRLAVIVPHAWTDLGAANPFHRHRFTAHTFLYFRADTFSVKGSVGYQANEGRPVADWASVRVAMRPNATWTQDIGVIHAAEHNINVIDEVYAIMIKKEE